jgi:hypothetical protein
LKPGRARLSPSFTYAKEFDIGPTPMLLPRGPVVKTLAGVQRLEKLQTILTRMSSVGEDVKRIADIPGIFKCKKLTRNLDQHHLEWGAMMQRALDTEGLLEMQVSISLDWVTAAAMSFQLQKLLEVD